MFKNIVKEKVKIAAFKFLTKLQETHSKSNNIKYQKLELQECLKSSNKMTIKEKTFIIGARSRMLDLKCNLKITCMIVVLINGRCYTFFASTLTKSSMKKHAMRLKMVHRHTVCSILIEAA